MSLCGSSCSALLLLAVDVTSLAALYVLYLPTARRRGNATVEREGMGHPRPVTAPETLEWQHADGAPPAGSTAASRDLRGLGLVRRWPVGQRGAGLPAWQVVLPALRRLRFRRHLQLHRHPAGHDPAWWRTASAALAGVRLVRAA